MKDFAGERLKAALRVPVKKDRYAAVSVIKKETKEALAVEFQGRDKEISAILSDMKYDIMREMVIRRR